MSDIRWSDIALENAVTQINQISTVFVILMLAFKCVFIQRYTLKQFVIICGIIIILIPTTFITGNAKLFELGCFIIAADNIDFGSFIKAAYYTLLLCFAFVFLGCFLGFAEDYIILRVTEEGIRIRHSLGFYHPNTLGSRIVEFVCLLIYMRWEMISWKEYMFLVSVAFFLKVVPDSQTSFIGILLLLLYCCIAKSKFLFLRQTISIGLVLISALSGLIFWGMVLLYQQGNAFITAIDKFLSSRIYWSGIMINRFGITAMGQKLPEDLDGWLDSTYIYMPIVFGYIPFILYALSYILMCIYLYKKGCLKELAMWAVFAVMGIMETYAFRVYYNVFLILIGCLIYRKSIKACEKLERVDDRI